MMAARDALFESKNLKAYIRKQHKLARTRRFDATMAEPETIGKTADEYAARGIADSDDDAFVSRSVVSWGSRLLYAIQHYGLTFEEVCDLSELSIARAVAALTPDPRLSIPKRHQMIRSAIVTADVPLQMIKLAELRAWAEGAKNFTSDTYTQHADTIRRWVDEARDLLPAFTLLQESYFFRMQLLAIESSLTEVGRPVAAAERPRRK